MYYINFRGSCGVETVDEFLSQREARLMLKEYLLVIPGAYISRRPTREWKTR